MQELLKQVEDSYLKRQVVDVRSGDLVRVHQKIKEGAKERVQIFDGLVTQVTNSGSRTHSITVRKVASGVGVEKSFQMHSPLVVKVEVTKRSTTRRNRLNYMRQRSGKSARLVATGFDKESVNTVLEDEPEVPEEPTAEAEVVDSAVEPEAETVEEDKTTDKTEAPESASAKAEAPVQEESAKE